MYFRNFTALIVKHSYLYFSSHGVYGSKVKKRNKHQYVNECHLISHHWSNTKYNLQSERLLKHPVYLLLSFFLLFLQTMKKFPSVC